MSARKPEPLSAQLKDTRNRLSDYRHCGLLMDHEQVEEFVARFNEFIDMARAMENGVCTDLSFPAGTAISAGSNVVAFPGRSPDHRPTGGSAA